MKDRNESQSEALNAIRNELIKNQFALCACATGYGKGHLIKLIASMLKENNTMLVVVPRVNLVLDISQRVNGEVYCASLGKKNIGKITVATKQSLKDIKATLYILDEVHTYKEEFLELAKESCTYLIGLTGTPYTSKGYIYGEGKFWNKPCFEALTGECIDNEWLVDYRIFGSQYAFDTSKFSNLKRDLRQKEVDEIVKTQKHELQVEEFIEICNSEKRNKVAVICANIEHAQKVHCEISKYEKCHLVHSKISNSTEISEMYKTDNVRFSVSVLQLSEGYDNEYIDGIVLLRPCRSTRLAVQIYGRGLRLSKNKEYCLILDYAEVVLNCGTPRLPRIPEDDGSKPVDSEKNTTKQCPECYFIYDKSEDNACPSCGHVIENPRDVEKNLKESITETSKIESMIVTKDNIYKYGVSKRSRQPYITLKVDGAFHTLFAYQRKMFFSALKKSLKAEITYTTDNKYKFKLVDIRAV